MAADYCRLPLTQLWLMRVQAHRLHPCAHTKGHMGLCRSGLQLPWAMRARLAELLLQCMFQDADASTRIDECEELVKVCCLSVTLHGSHAT